MQAIKNPPHWAGEWVSGAKLNSASARLSIPVVFFFAAHGASLLKKFCGRELEPALHLLVLYAKVLPIVNMVFHIFSEERFREGFGVFVEILGPLAVMLSVATYIIKDDCTLRLCGVLICDLWALYFSVHGNETGAIMNAIACVMMAASLLGFRKTGEFLFYISLLMLPYSWFQISQGLLPAYAILPPIGGTIINLGMMRLEGRPLTIAIASGELVWGIYALCAEAWSSATMTLVSLCALLIREYRAGRISAPLPA